MDDEFDALTPRGRDHLVARRIFGWDTRGIEAPPFFSSDMTSAWLIVRRMSERGLNLHLFAYAYNRTYAAFGITAELEGDWMAEGNGEHATEEAICRAALRAVAAPGDGATRREGT